MSLDLEKIRAIQLHSEKHSSYIKKECNRRFLEATHFTTFFRLRWIVNRHALAALCWMIDLKVSLFSAHFTQIDNTYLSKHQAFHQVFITRMSLLQKLIYVFIETNSAN